MLGGPVAGKIIKNICDRTGARTDPQGARTGPPGARNAIMRAVAE